MCLCIFFNFTFWWSSFPITCVCHFSLPCSIFVHPSPVLIISVWIEHSKAFILSLELSCLSVRCISAPCSWPCSCGTALHLSLATLGSRVCPSHACKWGKPHRNVLTHQEVFPSITYPTFTLSNLSAYQVLTDLRRTRCPKRSIHWEVSLSKITGV